MMDELGAFALLVGTVVDATTTIPPFTPQPPRTPIAISFDGLGTPPAPTTAIVARAFSNDGFVLAFDSANIPIDVPSSSGTAPKHLLGAFDVHFTLSADGYADLPATYACNKDTLPIVPAPYALQPLSLIVRGQVASASGAPVPGATVQITAASPAAPLPPATTTDANGLYVFWTVPAAQTLTFSATTASDALAQTIEVTYPASAVIVNLAFT